MFFTFGIITCNNNKNIDLIIDSIEKQNIPEYEIIIVGIDSINRQRTRCILFDESIYPGWITKKKNIITEYANYENIVFMHDYVILQDDWYQGFLKYGNNFNIIINKINNNDNTRYRDWILNYDFLKGYDFVVTNSTKKPIKTIPYTWIKKNDGILNKLNIPDNRPTILLNYNNNDQSLQKYIYLSGTYFVCKKRVMKQYPLNELLLHNQGEDVEWCQRVRNDYIFDFNPYSTVQLLIQKNMNNTIII